MQLDLRGAAEQSDSRPDHLILRPLTTVKVSNTMEMNMRGYRLVSREFSRIEAISVGTHGLSAVKVHNCGGFAGPESGGVGWHYG
ncbi:hypothetical protein, partial [Mycobacterium nebraskense]|uniref:hypothetical protein n=2 Tax=Mycobacterium TaxID=1763 RepID=UPI000A86022D